VSMVAKLSARKAKAVEDREILTGLVPQFDQLAARLLELSQDDIDAYRRVIEARKSGAEGVALGRAYERAAEVPLEAATAVARGLALLPEVSKRAWEMTASDLAVGSELLQTGFAGALGNVAINLPELEGEAADRIERAYLQLRALKGQ
jgi:formiminotetrahydrofolate cyclodeaminase